MGCFSVLLRYRNSRFTYLLTPATDSTDFMDALLLVLGQNMEPYIVAHLLYRIPWTDGGRQCDWGVVGDVRRHGEDSIGHRL